MSALLSIRGLTAGYGDSEVLQGIDLDVGQGEVVCLLGANGAGKTTTMAVITGLINGRATSATYDGRDLFKMKPHERVAAGIVLSPEGRKVFPELTVEENLLLGSFTPHARKERAKTFKEVFDLFPILFERRRQRAGLMSGGEQQMLAIGRALMAKPRLLLLDEPSLGLAPKIVLNVFEAIKRIAESDISILLVEQNAMAALSVASRGYVINTGTITFQASGEELLRSEDMRDAFIGKLAHKTVEEGRADVENR
jgi:branched-chain amino acid transport system ATP-binding protein